MGRIYESAAELIGRTPLLRLRNMEAALGLEARLLAKVESFSPAGSVKDRVALKMLEDAQAQGRLAPGGTIIEPTSGNTGIGLAAVAAARGYKAVIVMPDSMSIERRQLMTAFGARLELSPGAEGMAGAIALAERLHRELPGSIIAGQFDNPANPQAHFESTGPEIWEDTEGQVDLFVAGIGTGGTITGVGRFLKEKKPQVKLVGIEPAGSPYLTQGKSGPHGLMGLGAGFKPQVLDEDLIDLVVPVTDEEAYIAGRMVGKREGLLVGISSGAALHAAIAQARLPENRGKTIVTLFPDSGDRYLSTPMYTQEW